VKITLVEFARARPKSSSNPLAVLLYYIAVLLYYIDTVLAGEPEHALAIKARGVGVGVAPFLGQRDDSPLSIRF